MKKIVVVLSLVLFVVSCVSTDKMATRDNNYLPPEGKTWMVLGQDLGAVGGLDDYNQGYVDYIGIPAGVTTYTHVKDLAGLNEKANWGSGDVKAKYYLEDEDFSDAMIFIGLSLQGAEGSIADGKYDAGIAGLGSWIEKSGRPVFLRIGYEFEGPWNGYEPENYKRAYRRIVDHFRDRGISNFVTVWQSSSYHEDVDHLMQWYPGDDYVDWLGYSYFDHDPNFAGSGILSIARDKNKPVVIAEATPRGKDLYADDPESVWVSWFEPFFNHVEKNSDVVKAVAYINVRWQDQSMWKGQGWGDSRVQTSELLRNLWIEQLESGNFVHGMIDSSKPISDLPEVIIEAKVLHEAQNNAIEAESGTFSGNVTTFDDPAASGGKGAAYIYATGDRLSFSNFPATETLAIRYASQFSGQLGLYVDGERTLSFDFNATGDWIGVYNVLEIPVIISEGADVTIGWDEGDTAMNIDYIVPGVYEEPAGLVTAPEGALEAEDAKFSGNVKLYEDMAASGGKGAAYIYAAGDRLTFDSVEETELITIRYASQLSGDLGLYIDGERVQTFSFRGTGDWVGTYENLEVVQSVPAGSTLAIGWEDGDTAMNIDYILLD